MLGSHPSALCRVSGTEVSHYSYGDLYWLRLFFWKSCRELQSLFLWKGEEMGIGGGGFSGLSHSRKTGGGEVEGLSL